jgi:DNA-binding transcriptional MerR regulator
MSQNSCKTYTTKEIHDTFGIGRETLRHYENMGLLHPHINPGNGYREYGYWDMGTLVDILKYRSIGLSLDEVKKAMFELDFPQITASIEALHTHYVEEMLRYKMLEKKARIDLSYLKYAMEYMEEITEASIEDLFFIPYGREERNIYHEDMKLALHHSQFFESAWIFDEDIQESDPLGGLGFISVKEHAEYVGIKQGKVISASKVICKFTDVIGWDIIKRPTFEAFEKEAVKLRPDASKETYAILLSRFYDKEKRYHSYYFVFKKLNDTSSRE